MNPEPVNIEEPPIVASISRIVVEFQILEREEATTVKELERLREDQQVAHERILSEIQELSHLQHIQQDIEERLADIGRRRERWTTALQKEEERLTQERFSEWKLAEQWREEETRRVQEKVAEGIRVQQEITWDRQHLVGDFVVVTFAGGQGKGLVTERVTRREYTVLFLDGQVHNIDIRFIVLTSPTAAEREAFRNIGHPLHPNISNSIA
jgi:hypothetical protein